MITSDIDLKVILAIYIIVINIISFFTMYYDKNMAKKNKWRVKEKTIFILSLILGGIGTYIGMYTFRHKTKHMKFLIGIPVCIVLNVISIVYLYIKLIP